jgi:transposase
MMGQQCGGQDRLFYSFNLETHVPQDHLLRGIDRFLDLSELREHLEPFYSHTGRPSIDPELMIRMLLVGYCFGIRAERRLCEEVHLNLAYRWFCRLGLQEAVPDHSRFSKNRHGRFRESDVFRHLFEAVVQRCMAEGLVRGEGFAIDASIIKADANRRRGVPAAQGVDWNDPKLASRAVHEYLQALDKEGEVGAAPKNISLTDPAARWTAAPGCPAFFACSANYVVDVNAGIIVDVEATSAHRTEELKSTKTMIERVERRFDLKPQRLIGDTAYGSAPMLAWLAKDKGIEPHIPVWDKAARGDGTLSRSEFAYDAAQDCYTCPAGKTLVTTGRPTADDTMLYRASVYDCQGFALRPKCCPNSAARKIPRSIHEASRDIARSIATTETYRQSRKDRKKIEVLFAHLKRVLKLDRLRLRGPSGARDEFLLAATAQNLRRMAKWLVPKPPVRNLVPT